VGRDEESVQRHLRNLHDGRVSRGVGTKKLLPLLALRPVLLLLFR
jgi:hypothetical protein